MKRNCGLAFTNYQHIDMENNIIIGALPIGQSSNPTGIQEQEFLLSEAFSTINHDIIVHQAYGAKTSHSRRCAFDQ